MKSARALIVSALFLAAGFTLIFTYCTGGTSLNTAYPLYNSSIYLNVTATGPAALGGIALIGIGLLFLVWALLTAVVGQLSLWVGGGDDIPRVTKGAERILE